MPSLAIRHKFKRVTHYEIRSDAFLTQTYPDYIQASAAFDVLLETGRYGDFIEILEFRKNQRPEILRKLKW
jgi:hypothetical protein